MTTGTLRGSQRGPGREKRGRPQGEGAWLCRTNHGLTPALPGVRSADINGLGVNVPSGDRWNTAVSLGHAAPVRG